MKKPIPIHISPNAKGMLIPLLLSPEYILFYPLRETFSHYDIYDYTKKTTIKTIE